MQSLSNLAQVSAVVIFIVTVIVALATSRINKVRIDAMQDTLVTAAVNVEQLTEQNRLQHEKCERDRERDREECDRQITHANSIAQHALQEASAARSEVVGIITKTITEAAMAVLQSAVEDSAQGLIDGQNVIIKRLNEIAESVALVGGGDLH